MSNTNIKMQTIGDADFASRVQFLQGRSLNRLSSGSSITSPSDDPVGIGLAEKMKAQQKRIEAAQTNIQNALSLVQTSDGYLKGINQLLTRMSELTQMALDPSKNVADSNLYRTEFIQLQQQIRNTIGGTTSEIGGTAPILDPLGSYNGNTLFGPGTGAVTVSTGKSDVDHLTIPPTNLRVGGMLGIITQNSSGVFTLDISDPAAINNINSGIDEIAAAREEIGAIGSRLELAGGKLVAEDQSLNASISRITDTDVAAESTRLSKLAILSQTSMAMLAQASVSPKAILQLLQHG